MFNLIKTYCYLFFTLSRYQIITHSEMIVFPKKIKIFGYIISIMFYPIGLIKKPSDNFSIRLTNSLSKLGPIYIKLGQTLSTRSDLLGRNICEHLKSLHKDLKSFDIEIVEQIIFKNFNKKITELFLDFNSQPIAIASISQVHNATLKSGEKVAVKILKPNIHKDYNNDILFLYSIAKFIKKGLKGFDPLPIIDVFHSTMKSELNLLLEAASGSEFSFNLKNNSKIYIPKIYWNLTTEEILTTEWISGISLYDTTNLLKINLNLKQIAIDFTKAFFDQVYIDGFFHADLHHGNLFIKEDGKIAVIDFGIMGRISDKDRFAIAETLYALFMKDYLLAAKIHLKAGYIPNETNLYDFAQYCRILIEPMIQDISKPFSIGKLLGQIFKITENFGMKVQPQLLLLQKTIVVVEGVGQKLDSEINIWYLIEPWIKKWANKNLTLEAKILKVCKSLIEKSFGATNY